MITNKLTFDPPTRLSELTQNLIRSFHGHSTPSLKILCKSVQPFSRNVADKETKKSPENNIAGGVTEVLYESQLSAIKTNVGTVTAL